MEKKQFYFVFKLVIIKWDLKTPGREDDDVDTEMKDVLSNDNFTEVAAIILKGVGGKENVVSVENCITRLRLEVKDNLLVDEKVIKAQAFPEFVADEFKKMVE